jgi:Zn-dependent protease
MVQRAAVLDRLAVPVIMRPLAWVVLAITSIAAQGALAQSSWRLGVGGAWLAILLIGFVAVLIHELGHAVVANAVGGRVGRIVVFPIEFTVTSRKLRLVRHWGRGDLGGYVTYTLDRVEARRRHAIVAIAGPAANIVTGVAAGSSFAIATPGILPPGAAVATAFAIVSVGMGLANLIPFDGSDGMRLLRYFRPVRR